MVNRATVSLFHEEWEVIKVVQEQYGMSRSQAIRFITLEYARTHGITIPEVVPNTQARLPLPQES